MDSLIKKSIIEDEKDIKTGLVQNINGVFTIGRALKRIQDEKKYKTELGYSTFEEYIEQRIGFSKRTGYRYIEIATKLSENVSLVAQNLSISKLYLIASAVENEEQAIDFIKEKHIIGDNEKTVAEMSKKELEQAVKEKKEIKKQLDAEKEYSEELQTAIKQKEKRIIELQNKINNLQIPQKEIVEKEIIKEVIPNGIEDEIKKLKDERDRLQEERNQYFEKAREVEKHLKEVKLTLKSEQTDGYRYQEVSEIGKDVSFFLDKCSKYTYFGKEYCKLSWQHKKIVEDSVNKVETWVEKMKQALQTQQDISENLIYGEGEVIDE